MGHAAHLFVLFFLSFGSRFSFILPRLRNWRTELTPDVFTGARTHAIRLFLFDHRIGLLALFRRLAAFQKRRSLWNSTFYTSFFRGTPLLVQIFLIYLGLPQLGPVPDANTCASSRSRSNTGLSQRISAPELCQCPWASASRASLGPSPLE